MSLQVKIPPVPMTAPQCDDNDLTDDDFAKDSDDDFAKDSDDDFAKDSDDDFAKDSDESDDQKKVSKEGAAFVQSTHNAVHTFKDWQPSTEQDKSLKIKIMQIENEELHRTIARLETQVAVAQEKLRRMHRRVKIRSQ
jgi:hypothetical protein